MNDFWLRRAAQIVSLIAIIIMLVSAVLLSISPNPAVHNWLESQVRSIVTLGTPIIGLVIVSRQPRHRIGWLWILYGFFVGFRSLGHAIYYSSGAQSVGYSSLEYFLLWFTEPAGLVTLALPVLLMLWYPDSQLVSPRWRVLSPWLIVSTGTLFFLLFRPGPNWNGGATAEGIVIDNPYGWLPENISLNAGLIPFLSIVLITILAAASLLFRYRAAGPMVRLQLRWFVFGGVAFAILDNIIIIGVGNAGSFQLILSILSFASILPLYLAVGMAIVRYRLYDIDIIIRRTLQYTVLIGMLALMYFGGIVTIQGIIGTLTGEFNSPLITVITTLGIAALFNPLRTRVQDFIDRRFYRKKYNAEITINQFADIARDEVDIDRLAEVLLGIVEETMQPEYTSLWLGDDVRGQLRR